MKISIPQNISDIINILNSKGHEAYLVGGCVRDYILGIAPKDHDIATSAMPEEIKSCFSGYTTIDTGIKHGTVTVVSENENVEITTFRIDGAYSDHRRPDEVRFSDKLSEDLSRRDFTINAMAYSPASGLIDIFGGQRDLFRRRLCCVGEPAIRFNEDALRIMRALRFASELDFEIEESAAAAIFDMKGLLKSVSPERISKELIRMLSGKAPYNVLDRFYDVLAVVIPEILPCVGFDQRSRYHSYDIWRHIAYAVEYSAPIPDVRLALFLHDLGKPRCFTIDEEGRGHFKGHEKIGAEMASDILKRLKLPSDTINRIEKLIKYHYVTPVNDFKVVRRLLSKLGADDFFLLAEVMKGDNRAKQGFCLERVRVIDEMIGIANEIIAENQCLKISDLDVNGYDMAELGFKGPEIGKALDLLLEAVINEDVTNVHEELIGFIKKNSEKITINY